MWSKQAAGLSKQAQHVFRLTLQNKLRNVYGTRATSQVASNNVDMDVSKKNKSLKKYEDIPEFILNTWNPFVLMYRYFSLNMKPNTNHLFFENVHNLLGPIFRFKFGPNNIISFKDVKAVENFLRREEKIPMRLSLPSWKLQWKEIGQPYGLFLSEGEDWYRMRHSTNKVLLNTQKIATTADRIHDVTKDFLLVIAENRDQNSRVVLDKYIRKWTLETSMNVFLEQRLGLFTDNPNPEAIKTINAVNDFFDSSNSLNNVTPDRAKRFYKKLWRKQKDSLIILLNFARSCINERLALTENNKDVEPGMIEFIIKQYLQDNPTDSLEEMYSTIMEIMLAAIDTSSNTMLFTLAALSRDKDLQERLYKEIMATTSSPDEIPTASTFQNTPLLRAVLKESMRMYPVAFAAGRILQRDTEIMDYHVPEGVQVIISLYAMYRDPLLYRSPNEFRPERWIRNTEEQKSMHPFSYLPFGFGTRSCIGRRIAELEMHMFLYEIVKRYKLESTSTAPVTAKCRVILIPSKPVEVILTNR